MIVSLSSAYKGRISYDALYNKGIGYIHDLYICAFKEKKAKVALEADGQKKKVGSMEELADAIEEGLA